MNLRIERYYEVVLQPEHRSGPYPVYGKFTCDTDNEEVNNALAGYAEVWLGNPTSTSAFSFIPRADNLEFWVNSPSGDEARRIIDDSVELLKTSLISRFRSSLSIVDVIGE